MGKRARHQFANSPVHMFVRNADERDYALQRGHRLGGRLRNASPEPLHGIIDATPVWVSQPPRSANWSPADDSSSTPSHKEHADEQVVLGIDYPRHL